MYLLLLIKRTTQRLFCLKQFLNNLKKMRIKNIQFQYLQNWWLDPYQNLSIESTC